MEISIGRGLNKILFGMLQKDIENLLGLPSKKYRGEFDDIYWLYNDLKITLKFEKDEEYKLGWIEVKNPNSTLFSKKLISKSTKDVIDFISGKINDEIELNDYDSFESYTFNNNWLEIQSEYGIVTQINFGYLFDNEDNPIYPILE